MESHETENSDILDNQWIGQISDRLNASLHAERFHVRARWTKECIIHLCDLYGQKMIKSKPFESLLELVKQQFLNADLNHCGSGSLPPVETIINSNQLDGEYILQIDEFVNVSDPMNRANNENDNRQQQNRTLKFSMTDGVIRLSGCEWKRIFAISNDQKPGLKVKISNVRVSFGLLLLEPATMSILGGSVQSLCERGDEVASMRENLTQEENRLKELEEDEVNRDYILIESGDESNNSDDLFERGKEEDRGGREDIHPDTVVQDTLDKPHDSQELDDDDFVD